jgi:alanine-synthesizing transaminase
VQGSAFNITDTQHLRIVFLPTVTELEMAINKFARVLAALRT